MLFKLGWQPNISELGPVSPSSEVGREFHDEQIAVGFAYDQYWIVSPLWNQGGKYVVFFKTDDAADIWILKDQSVEGVARLTGIDPALLRIPFFYRVPAGWLILAGILGYVQLISGPGPGKRFARLWRDERYRVAIARLLDLDPGTFGEQFQTIQVPEEMPDFSARSNEVVQWLQGRGIGARQANRNLEFMMGYLIENRKLTVVKTPQPVDRSVDPLEAFLNRDGV